jgi:NH3-dependent NAD+ synthetase
MRKLDYYSVIEKIVNFIRKKIKESKAKGVVVGVKISLLMNLEYMQMV